MYNTIETTQNKQLHIDTAGTMGCACGSEGREVPSTDIWDDLGQGQVAKADRPAATASSCSAMDRGDMTMVGGG
jgi:hypothetical protein